MYVALKNNNVYKEAFKMLDSFVWIFQTISQTSRYFFFIQLKKKLMSCRSFTIPVSRKQDYYINSMNM